MSIFATIKKSLRRKKLLLQLKQDLLTAKHLSIKAEDGKVVNAYDVIQLAIRNELVHHDELVFDLIKRPMSFQRPHPKSNEPCILYFSWQYAHNAVAITEYPLNSGYGLNVPISIDGAEDDADLQTYAEKTEQLFLKYAKRDCYELEINHAEKQLVITKTGELK